MVGGEIPQDVPLGLKSKLAKSLQGKPTHYTCLCCGAPISCQQAGSRVSSIKEPSRQDFYQDAYLHRHIVLVSFLGRAPVTCFSKGRKHGALQRSALTSRAPICHVSFDVKGWVRAQMLVSHPDTGGTRQMCEKSVLPELVHSSCHCWACNACDGLE